MIKLIARFGQPPNLPWWRLKNMSEQEIEQFNRKHMVEIEMSEKPTDKQINDATNKMLDQYGKDMWNAAIEEAAKAAKAYLNSVGKKGVRTEAAILKLKK